MDYITLYVKTPEYTPQEMRRIDDYLKFYTPSLMKSDASGMPVREADGTWPIRVFDPSFLKIVKTILTDRYGLEIVREDKSN